MVQSVAGPVPFTVMAETRKEYSVPRSRPGHQRAGFRGQNPSFSQELPSLRVCVCVCVNRKRTDFLFLFQSTNVFNRRGILKGILGEKAELIQRGSNERHVFWSRYKSQSLTRAEEKLSGSAFAGLLPPRLLQKEPFHRGKRRERLLPNGARLPSFAVKRFIVVTWSHVHV